MVMEFPCTHTLTLHVHCTKGLNKLTCTCTCNYCQLCINQLPINTLYMCNFHHLTLPLSFLSFLRSSVPCLCLSLSLPPSLPPPLPASCLPLVPEQGTVGASGDLAPLSHLALGLMGEGLMWSPKSGWANAADVSKSFTIVHYHSLLLHCHYYMYITP